MAIYERFNATMGVSNWIVIQPSDSFKAVMDKYISSGYYDTNTLDIPSTTVYNRFALHTAFFVCASHDWREYVNSLEEELIVLVS